MQVLEYILSFIILFSLIGIWYFIKKSPNTKYRNISIAVAVVTSIVFGIFFTDKTETVQPTSQPTSTTQVIQSTSQKQTESSSVSSSVSSSSQESSTSSSSSDTSKQYDDEASKQYLSYLQEQINSQFPDSGISLLQNYDKNSVTIIVPREIAYGTTAQIQEIADNLLDFKNGTFIQWAVENNYSTSSKPLLFVQSERGTRLADEGAFNGAMKVKVRN